MSLWLGIDVGGTASRWVVVDDSDQVVARGAAPGATGHLFNPAQYERFATMLAAVRAAVPAGVGAVHAGVTGLGPPAATDARALLADAFGIAPAQAAATDDMELAYRSIFSPGEGHLISAGTGSIGLHLTADGERIRVGGRGILVDDGGSGTWIALTAIDRLYRIIDETGGPGEARLLAEHLAEAVGGDGWDQLRGYIYAADRGRIGELARVVAAAATAGDLPSQRVLSDAATELVRLARALIARVGHKPVAFIGGVLALHPDLAAGITSGLPDEIVRFPKTDPALAAARLARQHAGPVAHNSHPAILRPPSTGTRSQ